MSAVAIAARCGSTWKASRRLFGDQDGSLPRPIACRPRPSARMISIRSPPFDRVNATYLPFGDQVGAES
jgi:hypothetical protein